MSQIIVSESSIQNFLQKAGSLLYQNEAMNSLMLGLCETMMAANEQPKHIPLLLRIVENEQTVSAAIQTPPHNLVLARVGRSHIELLAQWLLETQVNLPGVVGPSESVETFAEVWSKQKGVPKQLAMSQRIYMLEKVIAPRPAEGGFRGASPDEADLLVDWATAFARESLPASDQRGVEFWREFVDRGIRNGSTHVWTVDGTPVSMASVNRPTKNGISVGLVFTPQVHRRMGYAGNLVARLSQKMLDSGKKFCVLYTDLANPTSNKIYQEVGYREICDSKHIVFM